MAQRAYDLLLNQSRGRDEQIAKANLEQAEARLQGSNAQLQFTEVRAPFDGIITEQFQYPGIWRNREVRCSRSWIYPL